ncbi:dephospho-CoA kinase [Planctomonas psychrotolerans]|uniref:dephospho-CoA kinase n=1 Tax=Planctomonas psychrotolerans TaxID=2528712 RepID=UPI00123BA1C1|nr:dephospho-CoA kinase [Planctomonas psychrotolerans]
MFLIGLTGGIAAGKSAVASRLAEHGAVHIDADVLAREVVEPGTPALRRIAEEFGSDVLTEDGALDRRALGDIVFADAGLREVLNSITHPAVRERTRELIAEATAANPRARIVYDVPLLVEAAVDHPFDAIVVVHATDRVRLDRLVRLRGMSPGEAGRRIAAQASEEERLTIADVVIDANGSLEETLAQTDAFWSSIPRSASS